MFRIEEEEGLWKLDQNGRFLENINESSSVSKILKGKPQQYCVSKEKKTKSPKWKKQRLSIYGWKE